MKQIGSSRLVWACALAFLVCAGSLYAEVTARSYVQNGLLMQWDGIENAGWGVHDATAAKPVELISGTETELTGTMPAGDRCFTFGSGYLHFTSETIKNAVNSGALTVEIVVKLTGKGVKNGGLIAFGNSTRGLWVWQNDQNAVIASYYYRATNAYGFGVSGENATTVSYLLSTSQNNFGLNGALTGTPNRGTVDMADADCYLGKLGGTYNAYAKASVFSIRIYSRKLTAGELASNAVIDRLRFGINPNTGDQVRFVPADAGETARSYVQDGLLAQWDGIENAGWGVHDVTAAKPVELISGLETELTGTIPVDEKSFTLGSGSLKFTSPEILAAINAGNATVEIVTSKNGGFNHNGGFFEFGGSIRGFWLYQQNDAFCNAVSYHGNGYTVIRYNLDGTNTLSFALSDQTANRWYISGSEAGTFSRYDSDVTETENCYIGMLASYGNLMPSAKVFSIRIYGRVLTAAEIAKNAAIDRRRFTGNGVACAASYVRSGLLAQWDGAENAGYGLHDISSDAPVEIASGIEQSLTNKVPADGKAFLLGSGYLKFRSQEIIDTLNAGHATVELVIAKNGSYVDNGGFVAFGDDTRAFWLYQQGSYILRCVSYHAKHRGQPEEGVFKDINFEAEGTNSLSFLLTDGATSTYNTNGFYCGSFPRSNVDTANDICYVGLLSNYDKMPNAKVFSIRVYDRVLTGAELENNQIADRLRFNLHDWTGTAQGGAWNDAANWTHSGGGVSAPETGANVRVADAAVDAGTAVDLAVLALENGGKLNLQSGVTVGTHVLLTNGVAVARGGYTGSGNRGTRVDWLSGPGLLRVGGGLSAEIPGVREFLSVGLIITIQ